MKRVILRLPEGVEREILSWSDGDGPRIPSPTLVRVLLISLGESLEWLDDEMDLDNPAPRRVKIRNSVYKEEL